MKSNLESVRLNRVPAPACVLLMGAGVDAMKKKIRALLTIAFLLNATIFTVAQASTAAGPAGKQFAAWLAAFDGNDREAYRQYLEKNFPSGLSRADRDRDVRNVTGGFELKKIEEETTTRVVALLQERNSDDFARVTFEVDAAEPYLILNEKINRIPLPAEFALPHLDSNELIVTLRKHLDEVAAADRFSGAVLVAAKTGPIFTQAYGFANRELRIPNKIDTRFTIASMGKMFTAVAILQLVQAGKLSLDDALQKHLPDYPNKELAAKVTIADLLTNTGGTGDIWGPEFDQHHLELRTSSDFIKLYGNRSLRFEPGSRWEYSNYGFILLGAVIEKVSGESYDDYVLRHIYHPAGMNATSSEPPADANLPVSYTTMGTGEWHPNTANASLPGTSAGGAYSTINDLYRFADALRKNKLLNPGYTAVLTTPRIKTPFGFDAYGFGVQTFNGTQCFGHNGATAGVNGDLDLCSDSGYIVIALANMDSPAAERVTEFVANRLPASASEK